MTERGALRPILHSKRAHVYYLERCRVLVRGGTVQYMAEQGRRELYRNIPIANTTFLLLGNGTSVTQAAMKMMASAGVAVGFCGGGGTPLHAAADLLWVTPRDIYQSTNHLHGWIEMWRDDKARLEAAKTLQRKRLQVIEEWWSSEHLGRQGFDPGSLDNVLGDFEDGILHATTTSQLLGCEGLLTRALYSHAAKAVGYGEFSRDREGVDTANLLLNHGDYLAYGCGGVVVWVLGLHPSLAVMPDKTRRGGLVFDFADIVKDGVILPQAFLSSTAEHTQKDFRTACVDALMKKDALQTMFDAAVALIDPHAGS